MDLLIIGIALGAVILLLIVVAILMSVGKKSKKRPTKSSSAKKSLEIDPASIATRIFKLAPSELKKAKAEYIGKRVEIRTVMASSKGSKKGNSFREVTLDFEGDRNYHIVGDVDMRDYKDQSWMTREGKLKVTGIVKDIQKKEMYLDSIKIV